MTTITPTVSATPGPSVDLSLSALPAGTTSLIVTRSWASTTRTVRQQVVVSGTTAFVRDYTPPIGRPASWTVQTLSAAGAVLDSATSGTVTVPTLASVWSAWVMDELDPRHALLVDLMAGSDESVPYDSPSTISYPADGGEGTFLSGPRRIGGRPFILKTATASAGDALEALIRRGSPLVIRCNPTSIRHRHGVIIVGASAITELPQHPYEGPSRWQVSGDECAPDAWPDTVPLVSWDDRKATLAAGTTWASRKAANPVKTWLQRQQEQGL